ncbi:nonspecific acid phosphatase precursor [Sporocytophaga myxococcoides]|uniref:Nonspecific acid phosphatase n=1 Tax=Sporocytophaga myxococcoides TaxID=153721 RepID=A0A098LDJ9_9BACT|nr:HAD family hydrolase [Sporocytophaga myxococcoides]GAL84514.1 nonspecific acid phosphatase precursor [Sporocytophaga myxococcoides]
MKNREAEQNKQATFNKGKSREKDPLPSWNNGQAKQTIIEFIKKVTDPGNAQFVAMEDRIAVFDNDGTLWTEQPYYSQMAFLLDRIDDLALQHPKWKKEQPFKALLQRDLKNALSGGLKAISEMIMATHAGMTTSDFDKLIKAWISKALHPRFEKLYSECVFLPMLQVLEYFKSSGFRNYIVSGGGIDFIRPWSKAIYGIPPSQVIGSSIKTQYKIVDGQPQLWRLPEINFIDDEEGKPVGIFANIGQQPIAAFGNSDGDIQMLEWVTSREPSLGMIIKHDDALREWSYTKDTLLGKLDHALVMASDKNWIITSMKNDWRTIFSFMD